MKKNNTRPFCENISDEIKLFNDFVLKNATKITLFEKVCLWFIKAKKEIDEIENVTLVYKIFRGKVYILNHYFNPPKQWNCRHSFKHVVFIALSLLCLTAKSQCPGLTVSGNTIVCNTQYVTLFATGASHYFWSTNGANKHQDSTASYFTYPYTWSGVVTLTAMCGSNTYTQVIQITYTYCTGINENEPNNQVQPVYYDLTGNKAEPIQGQILIEQRGIYRRKVLIQ